MKVRNIKHMEWRRPRCCVIVHVEGRQFSEGRNFLVVWNKVFSSLFITQLIYIYSQLRFLQSQRLDVNATITALNNRSSTTAEDTTGLPSLIQAYCALLLSFVPVRTDFSIQFLDVIWDKIMLVGFYFTAKPSYCSGMSWMKRCRQRRSEWKELFEEQTTQLDWWRYILHHDSKS